MALAVGVSTFTANGWLNTIKSTGTSFNVAGGLWIQLHTGIPGAAGTLSVSSVTTRVAITYATSTTGQLVQNGTPPAWTSWAGTNNEIVSHISCWDAATSGNFLWSSALTTPKTVSTGDTFSLSSSTITFTVAST